MSGRDQYSGIAAGSVSSPPEGEPNPPFSALPQAHSSAADLVGGSSHASRGEYNPTNIAYARAMRKKMTPWEFRLWNHIKNNQLEGYRFRRQQPIGSYIVDFLNTEKRLVVELDGSQHVGNKRDGERDAYLKNCGYTVLRFWNNEVDRNLEGVLTRILETLTSSPPRIPLRPSDLQDAAPPQGGSWTEQVP